MGVPENKIHPPTLAEEQDRVQRFLEDADELNWMIQVDGDVVGAVWVSLKETEYLPAPSVHIMIGDRLLRGAGVGTVAVRAVTAWLTEQRQEDIIFSRYRTYNSASAQLLLKLGFEDDGRPYKDKDGLEWQNVILRQTEV